jgi:hypothetical protein
MCIVAIIACKLNLHKHSSLNAYGAEFRNLESGQSIVASREVVNEREEGEGKGRIDRAVVPGCSREVKGHGQSARESRKHRRRKNWRARPRTYTRRNVREISPSSRDSSSALYY